MSDGIRNREIGELKEAFANPEMTDLCQVYIGTMHQMSEDVQDRMIEMERHAQGDFGVGDGTYVGGY